MDGRGEVQRVRREWQRLDIWDGNLALLINCSKQITQTHCNITIRLSLE